MWVAQEQSLSYQTSSSYTNSNQTAQTDVCKTVQLLRKYVDKIITLNDLHLTSEFMSTETEFKE